MPSPKQNPFLLKDFRGVNPDYIARLEKMGIKKAGQILSAGQTPEKRADLAKASGVPEDAILELVKLSDLARLPGVKGIRARLYYDTGVDTVEKLAAWEPEALLAMTADFVEKSGFDGIAPLPKEISSTIANARDLPRLVVW